MHRKAALGNVHKKEDTCGIPELKTCQTVTTHEILVKHLVLLTTFIELGCNAVILFFLGVCVHIHMYDKVQLCLADCDSVRAILLMRCSPGEASEVCGPYQPTQRTFLD